MAVYIKGMGNISPQKTWGDDPLLADPSDYFRKQAKLLLNLTMVNSSM
jgi:hypothetical protein